MGIVTPVPFLGPAIAAWIAFSILVMAAYFVFIAPKIGRTELAPPPGEPDEAPVGRRRRSAVPPPELGRTGWAIRWPQIESAPPPSPPAALPWNAVQVADPPPFATPAPLGPTVVAEPAPPERPALGTTETAEGRPDGEAVLAPVHLDA